MTNKPMTVFDLIEKLKEFDQNTMVVMPGYDGGYSEIKRVYSDPIKLNVHDRSFYENRSKGEHDTSHNNADVIAVVIQ